MNFSKSLDQEKRVYVKPAVAQTDTAELDRCFSERAFARSAAGHTSSASRVLHVASLGRLCGTL
jgi:hypothetical protein